jgi:hypothetical protein
MIRDIMSVKTRCRYAQFARLGQNKKVQTEGNATGPIWRISLVIVLVALCCSTWPGAVLAQVIVAPGKRVGTTPTQLTEISGIAVGRACPATLWVHQDSGDSARFYGLSISGELQCTITLEGLVAIDWEDMTIGPKPGGGNYLYFADIGDNAATRFMGVDIIRVTEPSSPRDATLTAADYRIKRLTYGNLDARNAESLLCDPLTRDLFIITKQKPRGHIYRLPADQFETAGISTLEHLGILNAPLKRPTSADISPDGKYILVRNSASGGTPAYLFERRSNQTVGQALLTTPVPVTLESERQGEAVAWASDGSGFYSISEGKSVPIWFYPVTKVTVSR